MLIIPAIDIQNKKCVRLFKGDFDQETIFSDNPLEVAKKFEAEGARWLHVIDLDGARDGQLTNLPIITNIRQETKLKIQIGGGIRDVEAMQKLLDLDIESIILGTMAINNPYMISYLKKSKIIISVDAKKGKIVIEGWTKQTEIKVEELITTFKDLGILKFIYTDVERDGTLTSPNFTAIKILRDKFPTLEFTIAGGVASLTDLKKLHKIGVDNAVVGTALYTNKKLRDYAREKNYTLS